jgi:hypothetical protein
MRCRFGFIASIATAIAFALVACSDGGGGTNPDAPVVDAAIDGSGDAGPDAMTDAGIDAPPATAVCTVTAGGDRASS